MGDQEPWNEHRLWNQKNSDMSWLLLASHVTLDKTLTFSELSFLVLCCDNTTCCPGLSCCCYVAKSCLTLCDLMDCSMPGFPILHYLPELAQIHVHWFDDAIQPSQLMMIKSTVKIKFFYKELIWCLSLWRQICLFMIFFLWECLSSLILFEILKSKHSKPHIMYIIKNRGVSLAVQSLRLCVSSLGGCGFGPWSGNWDSAMLHSEAKKINK